MPFIEFTGTGTFQVGKHVEPGLYRTSGFDSAAPVDPDDTDSYPFWTVWSVGVDTQRGGVSW